MKFYLQSFNDIVTNSSMEVYQEATDYTVSSIKDIIDTILRIAGSDKKCDDLFIVAIDYEDMLDSYFEEIAEYNIEKRYKDIIETIRELKDDSGQYLSNTESYSELVKTGLVGDVFPTIEEYTDNFDSDWSYPITEVKIIPKKNCSSEDLMTLHKINNLFSIEAMYNG